MGRTLLQRNELFFGEYEPEPLGRAYLPSLPLTEFDGNHLSYESYSYNKNSHLYRLSIYHLSSTPSTSRQRRSTIIS